MRISAPRDASIAVLTDAETRAAEQILFDRGVSPEALMERAGAEIAGIIAERLAGETILVACGPGNNGGDGYVVARLLRERGFDVRVAALAEPRTGAARL
ncbi:NAD(P)H-hydrate epimerase, partial [Sphingomonas bacterium]|uniref:NAD(P)H-hydrate epimerase n=1 Tax=Sphingomonas bacterium TaxID=1895847 RepID=UPI00266EF3B2